MALSIADRAYILETGRIVASGAAKELAESEQGKSLPGRVRPREVKGMYVRSRMTPNPITITRYYSWEALEIMREKSIRRLPVMDKDKLVGIVTSGI